MKIKLTRHVLVEDTDVMPTRKDTVVDVDDVKAKEFVALGLAVEPEAKKAPEPENKKAAEPANKAAGAAKGK